MDNVRAKSSKTVYPFLKRLINFSLFFFSLSANLLSQNSNYPDYIIWQNGDTVFCSITSIERESGKISAIDYLNKEKKKVELRSNFDISKIRYINVNNEFFWEDVPLGLNTKSSTRHMEIEVNGKIKIYSNQQLVLKTRDNGEKYIADPTAKFGGIRKIIKLDNGKYFILNKTHINKFISPHLLSCSAFQKSFKEKINRKNIVEAVKLYNFLCFN